MKLNAPTSARSARNMTRDVVIPDYEPLDVDALDMLFVRGERERKFPIESGRLDLDLAHPRNLLIREIEYESAGTRNTGRFVPTCLGKRQARRVEVESCVCLGAACLKERIRQINTDWSADPVG